MNRLICLVCLAFAVVMFGNMWTSFSRANHARLQVTVMHNDALRHRAYMPRDAWKHEEKQLTVDRDSATRSGFNALWKSGLLAALAVIAWRWDSRRRKRSSYRQAPSYKSTPQIAPAIATCHTPVRNRCQLLIPSTRIRVHGTRKLTPSQKFLRLESKSRIFLAQIAQASLVKVMHSLQLSRF